MDNQFYLVHKKILPDFIDDIIKIKDEIEEDGLSVSNACEKHNISRSTYYKYKDYVFKPIKNSTSKAIISFRALNVKGVLNSVLAVFAESNANIVTLNQDVPIKDYAFITVTIDISKINIQFDSLLNKIKNIDNIKKVELIAFEG
ncbi:MAG: ACT domain-containing protein [Bacilli bacterium]|jgi:chorismate mutase|nr:ACT domain-containing protein [Bacilli bacterium]